MSNPSNGNETNKYTGGGAYVPPHRRAQAQGKMQPQPHNNSNNPHPQGHHASSKSPSGNRPGGRQQQHQGRQGRSPATSPTRNNHHNNHHHSRKNYNHHHHQHHGNSQSHSNSHSRGRQSHSPLPNSNNNTPPRHHSPTRKEDLQTQKQQMHVLQDALDRICCINLERRPDRWQSFQQHLHQSLGKKMGNSLAHKIEKFTAVDGMPNEETEMAWKDTLVVMTWDASENAKWDRHIEPPMVKEMTTGEVGCALSHIKLWQELAQAEPKKIEGQDELRPANMMILEDDSLFYSPKLAMNKAALGNNNNSSNNNNNNGGNTSSDHPNHHMSIANHDFLTAFQLAWTQLPEDWDIWYLGFSDRGERLPVDNFQLPKPHHHHHHPQEHHLHHYPTMSVSLFRPVYGFHTHGYVLTSKAAQVLLDNLPVKGPLDVWLADNQWFGLKVYCSVVDGEGWKGTGAWLVTQNRKQQSTQQHHSGNSKLQFNKDSDIHQSGRTGSEEK